MPHLSLRTFDRLLHNQEGGGGLPGVPDPNQPPAPSFEKQPTPAPPLPGAQPLPGSQLPGTPPPPPGGGPLFQQPAPPVPQGAGGTFELSGWWRRVGATILDSLILTIPFVIIVFAILGVSIDGDGDGLAIGSLILTTLVWVALTLVYAPYFMSKWNGATPGKKAAGIRVVRTDGAPITFGFAALREVVVKGLLVNIASNLTLGLAGLLNYLWPLWDSEHRALHDMVVKTRVVRD